MANLFSAIAEGLRAALRRESIPEPSGAAPGPRATPGLLQVVFAREPLPLDPPRPAPARRGFFAVLFERESLGHDAPPPPPNRARWFTWIFGPEHLDDR